MEIENKIDQILKIVTLNQQDIAILKKDVAELKEDVVQLKKDVAQLKKDVADLQRRVGSLEERMTNLEKRMTNLEKRMTSLERSVTIIEHEHGEQLRALFDNMQVNTDEHKRLEKLSLSIESEIQATLKNHEKRITSLEGSLVPSF